MAGVYGVRLCAEEEHVINNHVNRVRHAQISHIEVLPPRGLQAIMQDQQAIAFLRKDENVQSIGVWGRSMGATAAVMRAACEHSLAACVVQGERAIRS